MAIPDLKTQKYDRQLRLWAANGQAALESAKICLVKGTATGTEILKNLILPGIGSYTVVDDKIVDGSDTGINFFLDEGSIGMPRAKRVTELLKELNDDVEGNFVTESVEAILASHSSFFHQFSMIITTDINSEHTLLQIAHLCWERDIPLVVVNCVGFVGYFRLQIREHTIVETHPENVVDLRLDKPFPELLAYAQSLDLDVMDSMDHGHVPYVVILLKCMDAWKRQHNGRPPQNYAEKTEFKMLIRSGARSIDEENFEEAIANAWKATTETKVSSEVQQIFADPACDNLSDQSSNFWIIARAIRDFTHATPDHLLPLSGALPDMKADTQRYVQLQTVYRQKAQRDLATVQARTAELLASLGRPQDSVTAAEVESFCKFAQFIKVIRGRSLGFEYRGPGLEAKGKEIGKWLEDPESNIVHYACLRGVQRFVDTHKRYPGVHDSEVEQDIGLLKQCVAQVLAGWGLSASRIPGEFVHEMCRFGHAELPNMAALVGGLVSQEAIKLVTRQYVPVNNTCIFDGTRATSGVFEM